MLFRLLFLFVFFISFETIQAQSIDSLLDLHFKARGGLDKIHAIKSIMMKGKASINKVQADYSVLIMRPNYIRIELKSDKTELKQGFDGSLAWIYAPANGVEYVQEMGIIEKERLLKEAEIDGPLVDFKSKGINLTLEGLENVDGRSAHVIKLGMPDGTTKRIYIDAKTHQSIKESSYRTVKGNSPLATTLIKVESVFDSYFYQDGIAVPKVITTYMDGNILSILKIESVQLNKPVSLEDFKPTGLPTQQKQLKSN